MDTRFDVGQVTELRRIEDARVRQGQPGLRMEFSELITRLTSGGVSPGTTQPGGKRRKKGPKLPDRDPRILQQAKRLWDKGWGRVLGVGSYLEYLATIPDLPTFPTTWDARFPHLVLVDRRVQVVETCRILNVHFDGTNDTLVPHDPARSITASVYWMRCQDGKLHRNRKPSDCRAEFAAKGDEVGGEAHEGLALYAQAPDLLEVNTAWDLPASVRAVYRGRCAYLGRWTGISVKLYCYWNDDAHPGFGSVSRGSADLNPRS